MPGDGVLIHGNPSTALGGDMTAALELERELACPNVPEDEDGEWVCDIREDGSCHWCGWEPEDEETEARG